MPRRTVSLAVFTGLLAILAASAGLAAEFVPGEVIVKYRSGVTRARRASVKGVLPAVQDEQALDLIGGECIRFSGMTTASRLPWRTCTLRST